jgi:hypothetical protein
MKLEDQESERQRLAEAYSNLSDAGLKELAEDPATLTDLALAALENEIRQRGLQIDLTVSSPEPDEREKSELVAIRRFRDLPEALLAKGLLESAGIECFLADDNMVRLDWFISNAIGNMRLQVRKDDAEAAIEILDQPVSEDMEQ